MAPLKNTHTLLSMLSVGLRPEKNGQTDGQTGQRRRPTPRPPSLASSTQKKTWVWNKFRSPVEETTPSPPSALRGGESGIAPVTSEVSSVVFSQVAPPRKLMVQILRNLHHPPKCTSKSSGIKSQGTSWRLFEGGSHCADQSKQECGSI